MNRSSQIPIPGLKKIDGWKSIPIVECYECLVSLSTTSAQIAVISAYHESGVNGALSDAYLREGVAERLIKAAELLPSNFRFVVLDAWRPLEVQAALFERMFVKNRDLHPEWPVADLVKLTEKYAAYPGIYIISSEEQRVESMLKGIAEELSYGLQAWSLSSGRIDALTGAAVGEDNEIGVLDGFMGMAEKSILLLRDYHLFMSAETGGPMLLRKLKDALLHAKTVNKTIIILAPLLKLPPEVEKLFTVTEFDLPNRVELRQVLANLCESTERTMPLNGALESLLDAASGLTTPEAEDAFALSIIETDAFTPAVVAREKANAVKKNGLLEIVGNGVRPEDIGGLEHLLTDLLSKRDIFTQAARDYGLPSPRGILTVGNPGTGKSLTAQACGNIFNVPLLRLEAGKIFASHVGESEKNWRTAFATAKAIAPCILWVDEVDGVFSGAKSSGQSDGGTTNRVIKAILQDMQFNGEGIFFVFTANDIDGLPDPLIDRLDVWSVDLPTDAEREAIWRIHITKAKRDPKAYDIPLLAKATTGYSGRQIEQVWFKAMTTAFNAERREATNTDIIDATKRFVATSITMAEAIDARRKRLHNRATPASIPEITVIKPTSNIRKLAAGANGKN